MAHSLDPFRPAVLVVEDEPLILMDMMDLVEEAGFDVYGAGNADRAIELLQRHPLIRVLVTGIAMPGRMCGLQLAQAVRDRWPPVLVVVVSGSATVCQGDLPDQGILLRKPYLPDHFIAAVRWTSDAVPV